MKSTKEGENNNDFKVMTKTFTQRIMQKEKSSNHIFT